MGWTEADGRQLCRQSGNKLSPARSSLRATILAQGSDGEEAFVHFWRILAHNDPPYLREVELIAGRDWRVDFLFPQGVVVEMEGVGHQMDRERYLGDIEKYNALAPCGYIVLRSTDKELEDNPDAFVALVLATIKSRCSGS